MNVSHQAEPIRKSLYDVLRENLRIASRCTYVHRLIYIGDHTFTDTPGDKIAEFMESTITYVNNQYTDEHLTGLILCYQKYFCHVVEGSEDSIVKHLIFLTQHEKYAQNFGRVKMLVCYHHINQRFLKVWAAVVGKPPTMLEKIDPACDASKTYRYVYNCVQKLYKLAMLQRLKLGYMSEDEEEETTGYSERSGSFVIDKYPDCLPEFGLIEFLLNSKYTQDINQYIELYRQVPNFHRFNEQVWPVPSDFVPLDIFDKFQDPATDLPTTVPPIEDEGMPVVD